MEKYCFSIAFNILTDKEDSEESVNDTWLAAWNNIPPRVPAILSTFLGKITRNISLNRWKSRRAYKRGGGEVVIALDELDECISAEESFERKRCCVLSTGSWAIYRKQKEISLFADTGT